VSTDNLNPQQMQDFLAQTQQSQTETNPLSGYMRTPQIYVTLPSKGKYYAPGTIDMPINGEVPVLSMSTRDELILKSPDALMNGQAVVDVIQHCIPSIKNAWEMPIVDLDTALISIRIASYGEQMEYSSSCPSCKEYNQYEIDLRNFLDATVDLSSYEDTIEFKDLKIKLKPQSFKSANTTNLEVFEQQRLITLVNDQTLDADQKQTKFNEIFEKMTSLTVKNIIGSIEYILMPDGTRVSNIGFIDDFITNSDRGVFEKIEKHQAKINEMMPNKTVNAKCPDCQHEYETPFTFDQSNFFALAS
jgi:hypothetical protein